MPMNEHVRQAVADRLTAVQAEVMVAAEHARATKEAAEGAYLRWRDLTAEKRSLQESLQQDTEPLQVPAPAPRAPEWTGGGSHPAERAVAEELPPRQIRATSAENDPARDPQHRPDPNRLPDGVKPPQPVAPVEPTEPIVPATEEPTDGPA